jgi:hypothetical protein
LEFGDRDWDIEIEMRNKNKKPRPLSLHCTATGRQAAGPFQAKHKQRATLIALSENNIE